MASKVNYPPELKLWTSVLALTIQDFVHARMMGTPTQEYQSAREWIYAKDQTPSNSFDNICFLCGLNPDVVREALLGDAEAILNRLMNRQPKEEACTEKSLSTETLG